MISLTPQQQKLFTFISSTIKESGVAPSFKEMAAHMGCKSKGNVHRIISVLEVRGRIRRLPIKARAIEIIEAKCPHCGRAL